MSSHLGLRYQTKKRTSVDRPKKSMSKRNWRAVIGQLLVFGTKQSLTGLVLARRGEGRLVLNRSNAGQAVNRPWQRSEGGGVSGVIKDKEGTTQTADDECPRWPRRGCQPICCMAGNFYRSKKITCIAETYAFSSPPGILCKRQARGYHVPKRGSIIYLPVDAIAVLQAVTSETDRTKKNTGGRWKDKVAGL